MLGTIGLNLFTSSFTLFPCLSFGNDSPFFALGFFLYFFPFNFKLSTVSLANCTCLVSNVWSWTDQEYNAGKLRSSEIEGESEESVCQNRLTMHEEEPGNDWVLTECHDSVMFL